MKPALPLDRFASIAAEIDCVRSRDEVLTREGLTPEVWEAVKEFWLERMAHEAARGRYALSQRYTQLYAEHRRAHEVRLYPKTRVPKPPTSTDG
jgi:hypothetical protein